MNDIQRRINAPKTTVHFLANDVDWLITIFKLLIFIIYILI